MSAARFLDGQDRRLLLVCDHASNAVPHGVSLCVPPQLMDLHIAHDIGAGPLAERLASSLGAGAWLATVSRLVADFNRPPESCIPESSDGHAIPGNVGLAAGARAERLALHRAFHEGLAALVAGRAPVLLVSVHSFTPALATSDQPRPWPVGLLWNRDDRAAALGLAALRAEPGLEGPVGANEPYSGRILNYTMDRHAEANGIPYLGIEVRQDLLADDAGIARWTGILARMIRSVLSGLERLC